MIARDFDEHDDPDEPESWADDDDLTEPCPHCSHPVYDDAERCPSCGSYLSREDTPHRKPWWVVAGVLACLAMVVFWIFHP
jgi:hypothetical protein